MLDNAVLLVFPAAMAFAGAMDLLTMTIPNRVALVLAAAFFPAAALAGFPIEVILLHVGAGALVLAVAIGFFAAGWIGGGDGKLVSVAALWIGFDGLLPYVALVGVFGGVLALTVLAYRQLPAAALPGPDWALRLHRAGTGIPYGLAIAGAALWVYPKTAWFAALGA